MAVDSLHDFSTLTAAELYAVYLAVAQADHRWRILSLYGEATPPKGHSEFRPLPQSHFELRFTAARSIPGGEAAFRAQLARHATAYRLDVGGILAQCRTAA